MESLLSLSFDNLSSKEPGKIRKGLRQLEGLLAQICLSRSAASPQQLDRRRSVATPSSHEKPPKELSQLRDDPAFREFFKLQEGFQWNGQPLQAPRWAPKLIDFKSPSGWFNAWIAHSAKKAVRLSLSSIP